MFKNYFKTALRNIYRNKVFSFINITGLAIGLAISFCLIIYVSHELSYDKHQENYDRIYRVDSYWEENSVRFPMTPLPLGPTAKERIPGVEEFVRVSNYSTTKVFRNNEEIELKNKFYADPSIFDVFTFPFIQGNPKTALNDINSVVLSDESAFILFGRTDVVGETLKLELDDYSADVQVTGVIQSTELPSTINPDIILPLEFLVKVKDFLDPNDWVQLQAVMTYLISNENVDVQTLAAELKKINDERTKDIPGYVMNVTFGIIPLSETFYTYDGYRMPPYLPVINLDNIIIYSVIAALILLLASFNFIILSSAKSSVRNIEMGVRKVIGARRKDIVSQIMFESVLTALIAFPLSVCFIEIIFPYMEEIINREISASFYHSIYFLVGFIVLSVLIGIFSGTYVAFILAKTKPVEIFQKRFAMPGSKFNLKRILITFQMAVFISLIVSTFILRSQLNLTHDIDMGYVTDNQVAVYCSSLGENKEAFLNTLKSFHGVVDLTYTSHYFPVDKGNRAEISSTENPDDVTSFVFPLVGINYPKFINLELIEGEFPTEDRYNKKVIINETAAKVLGLKQPIGKTIVLFKKYHKMEIIGVVKDFHINSLRDEILPVAMEFYNNERASNLLIKLSPGATRETMNFIEEKWSELTNEPIYYEFVDERIDKLYTEEIQFSKVMTFFTIVAIVIAVMGLFGVVLFSVQRRTKEIAIRKILGASVPNIMKLLSIEFLILLIAGIVVASPVAYYFMNKWLENFAYRVSIEVEIFILSGFIAALLTFFTILLHVVKAAIANPVESLRYE